MLHKIYRKIYYEIMQAIVFSSGRRAWRFIFVKKARTGRKERAVGQLWCQISVRLKKMSWRLPGFPPLLSAEISLHVSCGTHLSCPRNRHSRLPSRMRDAYRGSRYATSACGKVMRAKLCLMRFLGSFSRGDVRIVRHSTRRISPEKLAAKLRLLSLAIARPGF